MSIDKTGQQKSALAKLPNTLTSTYHKILRERYGTKEGDKVYKYYFENVVNKTVRRLPK